MSDQTFIANTILSDPLLTKDATLYVGTLAVSGKIIFTNKYQMAKRTGLSYDEVQPEILCRNSFTENSAQDSKIVIDSTTYYLDSKEPLNNGLTKWTLKLNPVRT